MPHYVFLLLHSTLWCVGELLYPWLKHCKYYNWGIGVLIFVLCCKPFGIILANIYIFVSVPLSVVCVQVSFVITCYMIILYDSCINAADPVDMIPGTIVGVLVERLPSH